MKTLILDYSKWRCGGFCEKENRLGEGNVRLLNHQGFMCCLGQWSLQLDKTLENERIFDYMSPAGLDLEHRIPLLTKVVKLKDCIYDYCNTDFSERAQTINDANETSPVHKIRLLRSLCKKYKYKLRVINKKIK